MSATTMSPKSPASAGKIRSLDFERRELICQKMRDGLRGRALIEFLNQIAPEYAPFNAQNVSNWRKTGYREWLKQQEKLDIIRRQSEQFVRLSRADGGGGVARLAMEATAALAEAIQSATPENISKLASAAAALIQAHTGQLRLAHENEKVTLSRRALDLEERKFRMRYVQEILRHYEDPKVQAILMAEDATDAKIEKLGKLIFGDHWDGHGDLQSQ